jgi:hypothetical protein
MDTAETPYLWASGLHFNAMLSVRGLDRNENLVRSIGWVRYGRWWTRQENPRTFTLEPTMFKSFLPTSSFFNPKRIPLAVALAICLISADLAHGQSRLPDCYLLSAGVDNYPRAGKLKGDLNDARNTTAAFTAQQGKLFGKVHAHTLLDGQATRSNMAQRVQAFTKTGTAGDYVVVFFSGHAGVFSDTRTWYLLPYDYDPDNAGRTVITDRQLLDAADVMVRQGKKVIIIIDACFSGQLRTAAQPYFNKYRDPSGGGLIVMVSSSADQTSNALGEYSAFAKAFADSMAGLADLNRDGKITLEEIRQYSFKRTQDLLRQHGNNGKQDSAVAWSPSIAANTPLALVNKVGAQPVVAGLPPIAQPPAPPVMPPAPPVMPPAVASKIWVGAENLTGYGRLSFSIGAGGRAVMVDAKATSEGTWEQNGNRVTLRFDDGRVVYTGVLNGTNASGTATNGRTTWSWIAYLQTSTQEN